MVHTWKDTPCGLSLSPLITLYTCLVEGGLYHVIALEEFYYEWNLHIFLLGLLFGGYQVVGPWMGGYDDELMMIYMGHSCKP